MKMTRANLQPSNLYCGVELLFYPTDAVRCASRTTRGDKTRRDQRNVTAESPSSVKDDAIGEAEHRSRSHDAVIRIYDEAGKLIETHEHAGDFETSLHASRATRSGLTFWTSSATRRNWRTPLTQYKLWFLVE